MAFGHTFHYLSTFISNYYQKWGFIPACSLRVISDLTEEPEMEHSII